MKNKEQDSLVDNYEYRISWSSEDKVYLGRVVEFPSLIAHGESPEKALKKIRFVVSAVIEDMEKQKENSPKFFNLKSSGGSSSVHQENEEKTDSDVDLCRTCGYQIDPCYDTCLNPDCHLIGREKHNHN